MVLDDGSTALKENPDLDPDVTRQLLSAAKELLLFLEDPVLSQCNSPLPDLSQPTYTPEDAKRITARAEKALLSLDKKAIADLGMEAQAKINQAVVDINVPNGTRACIISADSSLPSVQKL